MIEFDQLARAHYAVLAVEGVDGDAYYEFWPLWDYGDDSCYVIDPCTQLTVAILTTRIADILEIYV